jgi:hypothetical protein
MNPQEHHSEARRLVSDAEAKRREPNQQFNPEPWLKAQTHALLAVYGQLEEIRTLLTPSHLRFLRHIEGVEPIPGEAE